MEQQLHAKDYVLRQVRQLTKACRALEAHDDDCSIWLSSLKDYAAIAKYSTSNMIFYRAAKLQIDGDLCKIAGKRKNAKNKFKIYSFPATGYS